MSILSTVILIYSCFLKPSPWPPLLRLFLVSGASCMALGSDVKDSTDYWINVKDDVSQ